jgi:tetratricopeptide (TPR) repeat protein
MISEQDDHIPAPAAPKKGAPRAAAASPALRTGWGDRLLFASLGLLLGFAAAYLYIERAGGAGAGPAAADPHAGLPGFEAGATRDLPGAGGGAAPIGGGSAGVSADPAARQQIAMLQAAAEKDPGNYDLLVKLGNAAYDANDPRLAADSYEKALAVRGGDPNVLTDLGVSYRNLGDLDRALQNFDRALKSDPTHWQAAFNKIVVVGLDKGDVKAARELLARLKKSNQNIPALDRLEKNLDEAAKGR